MSFDAQILMYLDGELVDERTIDLADLQQNAASEIGVRRGVASGTALQWLIEIRFPDGELLRWGSDADGGPVTPRATLDQLDEVLAEYAAKIVHAAS